MSRQERAHLSRPFSRGVWTKGKDIARQYRLVIEREPEVGYVGYTMELPLVMADGRTIDRCAASVLEATTAAVATLLEEGRSPPAPAGELRRDQQLNLRLTSEEKLRLEALSRREGFRSVSDYVRAAALRGAA